MTNENLLKTTKNWAEQAWSAGWITAETAQQLSGFDDRTPESLFGHNGSRPLIVAFMGGTGVGKSSLLNRLAGKPIAKAGVERPTSREVTLFHHHSVTVRHLPGQLPLAQIKMATHGDESRKNIIWIDMPDFDSTEQSNKHQVLEWIPHIDVLIYVVSPERYRDEKAWRLLLAEGDRHAWLFVLNQWDKGLSEQYEDFKQQLHKAGFAGPMIFKTACAEGLQADEFALLESTITSLATGHVVEQLEQRNARIRTDGLKQQLQNTVALLGSVEAFQQLQILWQGQWQHTASVLQQGFAWPLQQMAQHLAAHAADLYKPIEPKQATKHAASSIKLWDGWAEARFDDALDDCVSHADQLGIPVSPLKKAFSALRESAPKTLQNQCEISARQALANPGNAVQRGVLTFMRFCEILLPLLAIAWVGYQVFTGYYHSNMSKVDYLGVDFAVHSSLLIAITWLTPFFILKKVKPSVEKSVLKGLKKGLNNALGKIDADMLLAIENIAAQQSNQIKGLTDIMGRCDAVDTGLQSKIDGNSPLVRMLID